MWYFRCLSQLNNFHFFLFLFAYETTTKLPDISGNMMGDIGARLLAKALQINNKLRAISLDRNNITLQGNNTSSFSSSFDLTHLNGKLSSKKLKLSFFQDSMILSMHWKIIAACEIFHFRFLTLRHVSKTIPNERIC